MRPASCRRWQQRGERRIRAEVRTRISLGSEHAHQALGRCACCLRQLLKSDGCVDVVAENRLADFDLAGNELLHGFRQKRFTELDVALGASLNGLLEVSG
jgi:hypothetical protein